MSVASFELRPESFGDRERPLLEAAPFSASTFRFDNGVCALRLRNDLGEVLLLPFQGQQLWSARFAGRELAMRSMFDAPRPTERYLESYGALLIHCGICAMGVPGEDDDHPLHGELPNARYAEAQLRLGEDAQGRYLALAGRYRHTVAFRSDYRAEPELRLYAGSSLLRVTLEVSNLKRTPMELMYLAHINFRPVDGGRLVYSAPADREHVRVRRSVPSHLRPGPGYREGLEAFAREPQRHHRLEPGLPFDPEVVFVIDYLADDGGWAHSLQVHPDGSADYVRHRPEELPVALRWICRTPDQDALGLVLPATAEAEGYLAERAKGNLVMVPPGGRWRCRYDLGTLAPDAVGELVRRVERRLGEPAGEPAP